MPIPFNSPSLVGNEINYLRDAVRRGQLSGDGHYTRLCNDALIKIAGCHRALITHSCTAALEMAAILCDLGPGDEVILPSFTFVSTANAVVLRGATPVFVDIDINTLNIDPDAVEAAVTPKTRAIIAVHYAGFPCDMARLADIAKKNDLILVEDAAQALGSTYKDRPAGSLGDIAAFSFHETKNVISGEGGALCLNRTDMVERAEIIREKGTNRSHFLRGQVDKYTWMDIGSSFLPGELVASYLFAQLEVEDIIRRRRLALFDRYNEALTPLANEEHFKVPVVAPDVVGNGHMFYLLLPDPEGRNVFIDEMRARGVLTPFHYVPLHSSPAGRKYGRAEGSLAATNHISQTLVRLPMYFDMGSSIEDVIDLVHEFFSKPIEGRRSS